MFCQYVNVIVKKFGSIGPAVRERSYANLYRETSNLHIPLFDVKTMLFLLELKKKTLFNITFTQIRIIILCLIDK